MSIIDPTTGELSAEGLLEQYKLCLTYSIEGTYLLECSACVRCAQCPVYGTQNYARRKIPFCPFFAPNCTNSDDF